MLRRGDTVQVISGSEKTKRGKVLRVDRATGKVIIQGINLVYKHMRRSRRNPQGGRLSKEMPVQTSNVLLVCPSCKAAARTGARFLDDGSKERYCKKCGAGISVIAPPRTAHAKK